jgi:hypothetical protein
MGISQNYFQGKEKLGYTKPWSVLYCIICMWGMGVNKDKREEANDF